MNKEEKFIKYSIFLKQSSVLLEKKLISQEEFDKINKALKEQYSIK